MAVVRQQVTANELLNMPDDGFRYELVQGELRQMNPAGIVHGRVTMSFAWRLAQYVDENRLGTVYAAETGFRLSTDPDTVRAEDFAFAEAIREGRQTERVERDFGDELVPFSVPRPTPYASNARQQAGLHAENGTIAKQVREREHELEEAKRALKEERREVEHLREINAALETKVMSSPAGVEGLM